MHWVSKLILGTAAIIVTGGTHGARSAELLHGNGSHWCSLPDLPEGRMFHSQTGPEACGGKNNSKEFRIGKNNSKFFLQQVKLS